MEYAEYIEHYGVKGMRWGQRKQPASVPNQRRVSSGDHKQTQKLRSQPTRTLTNKELKKINERLNLEQNYSRLNKKKQSKGEEIVKDIMKTAGVGSAGAAAKKFFKSKEGQQTMAIGKAIMGVGATKAADAVFPIASKAITIDWSGALN